MDRKRGQPTPRAPTRSRNTRWLCLALLGLVAIAWVGLSTLGSLQALSSAVGMSFTAQQKEYLARRLALMGPAPSEVEEQLLGAKAGAEIGVGSAARSPAPRRIPFPFSDDAKYRIYSLDQPDTSPRCRSSGICDGDSTRGHDGLQAITSAQERREAVRKAAQWTWQGYKKFAWGLDELDVSRRRGVEWFKVGLTIVDGVDTLLIMGLHDEAMEARQWIANHLVLQGQTVSVFESTIRVLGGLLSAFYHSDGDQLYLNKALEFAERILHAFDTDSGLAVGSTTLGARAARGGRQADGKAKHRDSYVGSTNFAEAGTLSMEFSTLSHIIGDPVFRDASMAFWYAIMSMPDTDGLYCTSLDGDDLRCQGYTLSVGAASDSAYEYMLKQWILSGGEDTVCLDLYRRASVGLRRHLVTTVRTAEHPEGIQTLAEAHARAQLIMGPRGKPVEKPVVLYKRVYLEHLTCFVPGMLALGHMYGQRGAKGVAPPPPPPPPSVRAGGIKAAHASSYDHAPLDGGADDGDDDLMLGVRLMRSCYELYSLAPSGLAFDAVLYDVLQPPPPPEPPEPPSPPPSPPSPPRRPDFPSRPPRPPAPPPWPPLPPDGHPYIYWQGNGYRDPTNWVSVDPRTGQYVPDPPQPSTPPEPAIPQLPALPRASALAPPGAADLPRGVVTPEQEAWLQMQRLRQAVSQAATIQAVREKAAKKVDDGDGGGDNQDDLVYEIAKEAEELGFGVGLEEPPPTAGTPDLAQAALAGAEGAGRAAADPAGVARHLHAVIARQGGAAVQGPANAHPRRQPQRPTRARAAQAAVVRAAGRVLDCLARWLRRTIAALVARAREPQPSHAARAGPGLQAAGPGAVQARDGKPAAGLVAALSNVASSGGQPSQAGGAPKPIGAGSSDDGDSTAGSRHGYPPGEPQATAASGHGRVAGARPEKQSGTHQRSAQRRSLAGDGEVRGGPSAGRQAAAPSPARMFKFTPTSYANYLRPEVIESLFYLYRGTGDQVYREWGWSMFRAYEHYAKMPKGGYAVMDNVDTVPPLPGAKMESFWLAETLKYFYLLFSEPEVIPLDTYVFNTEAHPLPIWGSEPDRRVLATLSPETRARLRDALDSLQRRRRAAA